MEAELKKIRRYKLIIIDEVGYIPFGQDAANRSSSSSRRTTNRAR
ncbi:hypothetical protein ACFZB5_32975 [Streptomyces nodosus]